MPVSFEDLVPTAQPAPGSLESLRGPEVKADQAASPGLRAPESIGAGLINALLGAAGQVGDVQGLIDLGLDKLGMPPRQGKVSGGRFAGAPTSGEFKQALEENVGPVYKPQPGLESALAKGGELLPNIMFGPGGVFRRGIENVAMPYIGGESGKKLAEGTGYEDIAQIGGELAGGMSVPSAEKIVRPNALTPSRQRLVDIMAKEGIPLTAGQQTRSRTLQNIETEIGGGAYQRARDIQADKATQAAMRRIGGDETRATPDVIKKHVKRMGDEFNRLEASSSVPLDQNLQDDLINRVVEYQRMAGVPAEAPQYIMNRIGELAAKNGDILDGEALKNIRSEMGRMIETGTPELKGALRDMQEALDDAIERNISPEQRGDWQTVRRQYRNYIVLEDAITKAGSPDIAEGIVPPGALWGPQVAQNQRKFATGQDDYSDLAHAGGGLLREPPQSGTPGRAIVRGVPAAIGGGTAAILNQGYGDWDMANQLVVGGATLAAPYVTGRVAMSKPVQSWLKGQKKGALSEAARRQLLLQALMAPRLFQEEGGQ